MADFPSLDQHLVVLRDLTALFSQQAAPYCVIGGVAATLLGRSRSTRDVDAVTLIPLEQVESFLEAAHRFGIIPRIADPLGFARRHRILLLKHQASGMDVDVSIGGLPFEHESVARASTKNVQDVQLRLPSPEDFIIMKAVAGRPHDWVDIESVLDAHPKLNLRRVRRYLKQFAEVLDSPDMTERFESIVAQRRGVRSKRKST